MLTHGTDGLLKQSTVPLLLPLCGLDLEHVARISSQVSELQLKDIHVQIIYRELTCTWNVHVALKQQLVYETPPVTLEPILIQFPLPGGYLIGKEFTGKGCNSVKNLSTAVS